MKKLYIQPIIEVATILTEHLLITSIEIKDEESTIDNGNEIESNAWGGFREEDVDDWDVWSKE